MNGSHRAREREKATCTPAVISYTTKELNGIVAKVVHEGSSLYILHDHHRRNSLALDIHRSRESTRISARVAFHILRRNRQRRPIERTLRAPAFSALLITSRAATQSISSIQASRGLVTRARARPGTTIVHSASAAIKEMRWLQKRANI